MRISEYLNQRVECLSSSDCEGEIVSLGLLSPEAGL